ncbi:ABC transporter substrate-binding protein [Acuticoccus kandeliae]|uniref:ABC transporter substrate-binding protein n=1 Tax=Acuticoccus kandeliae TaxID=2073160 RepID=UPI000D3E159D|nr:ABC transporter substrate-binding protein [Acuticoccus kandeliae]
MLKVTNSTSVLALAVAAFALFGLTAAEAANFNEAPALAAKVKAGALPAVDERLPENPMVVTPEESVGQYGGTWRATMLGASDHWWLIKTVSYEPLIRFDPKTGKLIPNLAESFEANDTATEFKFTLRDGLRWSDGEPYTVDDIMFWYEDVFTNRELTPAAPGWLSTASGPAELEKIDDRSFVIRFKEPNGLFLRKLASNSNIGEVASIHLFPRHYLEKLLPKYNPNADADAKAAGASSWAEHFGNITGPLSRWRTAGMPTMLPWMLTSPYDDRGLVASERNPYYFKVDTENNQLPYLDGYEFRVVQDPEAMVLRAIAGEIDLQDRTIGTLKNKAVLFDNQEKGNYHLFDVPTPDHNQMIIYLNLNNADQAKRELYQSKDFRVALSHGIDRQEIIDLVYFGQGEPWQAAPRPDSVHYDEEMAKQYTEYDPEKANAILDELGFTERDSSGYRLDKSGNRIQVFLEVPTDFRPDWTDVVELIKAQWEQIGVDLQIRPLGRALIRSRALANEHDAFVFIGNGGLDTDLYLEANNFFPADDTGYRTFALLWSNDFHGLSPSEEPPASVKVQFDARKKLLSAADPAVQQEAMQTIIDGAKDAFYTIGIALPAPGYGVVGNAMHNVPSAIVNYGPIPYIGVTNPEQFYKAGN